MYKFEPKHYLSVLKSPIIEENNKLEGNSSVKNYYKIKDWVLVRNNSKEQKWVAGRVEKKKLRSMEKLDLFM